MKDAIIIHCSATRAEQDITAADIESWHRALRILDDRLPLCHPPRRNNRTRKRRHPRRRTLHGVEQTGNRHLLCRRTGQGRSPRRYTHRRATHRTHPTGEALRLVFPGVKQVLGHRDTSPDLNGDGVISPNEYMKACPCFDVQKEGF